MMTHGLNLVTRTWLLQHNNVNRQAKVSNVAETNPMEFANILSEKLQRVLEEQAHSEMFRCKLNAMSEVSGDPPWTGVMD